MTDEQLRYQFDRTFREEPDLIIRSPGRVNLIGEHTDYNDGWALPMALDLGTDIAARRRDDRILRIAAPLLGAADVISVDDLDPRRGSKRNHYVRGTAALLRETGCRVPGADLLIDGDLPVGAGLSSSASLELAVAAALAALADYAIDGAALARLGQRVENEIIGVRSGIMDQLARLTGAGFGGCVIAIAITDRADSALKTIVERYRQVTGLPGNGFACAASDGTHIRWTAKQ